MTEPWFSTAPSKSISLIALCFSLNSFQMEVGSVIPPVQQVPDLFSVVEGWTLVLLTPAISLWISLSPFGSLLKFPGSSSSFVVKIVSITVYLEIFTHILQSRFVFVPSGILCIKLLTGFLVSPLIMNIFFSKILLDVLSEENALVLFFCLIA